MLRLMPFFGWFFAKDIIIDVISALILIFILTYSIRYYSLRKRQTKYRFLIASFVLLTLSFIFKIVSHFVIYSIATSTKRIGIITFTYQTISHSPVLVFWGLLIYRMLSLVAFYLFYAIYLKRQTTIHLIVILYLLLIIGYFGAGRDAPDQAATVEGT